LSFHFRVKEGRGQYQTKQQELRFEIQEVHYFFKIVKTMSKSSEAIFVVRVKARRQSSTTWELNRQNFQFYERLSSDLNY